MCFGVVGLFLCGVVRLSARFYPDGSRTVSNVEAANSLFRQASEEASYGF